MENDKEKVQPARSNNEEIQSARREAVRALALSARREAVGALALAERKTTQRKVGDEQLRLWIAALNAAKDYKDAAHAWLAAPPADNAALREERYAEGFYEKVLELYREIRKPPANSRNTQSPESTSGQCKRRIHLVHSSKGGCGKTCTALTYAMYLARKYAYGEGVPNGYRETDINSHRVLLIDADFRGAGIETQLLETYRIPNYDRYKAEHSNELMADESEERSSYESETCVPGGKLLCTHKGSEYYNRCMMRNQVPFIEACISHMRMYRTCTSDEVDKLRLPTGSTELRIGFDVMFADSGIDAKRAFLANAARLDGTIVHTAYFHNCFTRMLQELQDKYPHYTDIIIDMSPGTDEYVDCIKEVCLDKQFADSNRVILHAVTTSDQAHLKAMAEYLEDTISHTSFRLHDFKDIRLILNETHRNFWNGVYDEHDYNIPIERPIIIHNPNRRIIETHYSDPGGRLGLSAAKVNLLNLLSRVQWRILNPHVWIELYAQLYLPDYYFDDYSDPLIPFFEKPIDNSAKMWYNSRG
jgi:Mrp family chromosome partitioning ATPase